jgi:hypothetical protein
VLEQRIQKGPTKGAAKSFKFGDWIVIPWDGTDPHPGKNKPHKLAPTWQGPYKVTGPGRSDSLIAVIDPADLKPYEFPIARCRLYNLAPGDNPVEIIAWDTDEAIVEQIVDHYSRAWVQRTMFGSLGAKLMSYRLWMTIVQPTRS